ncbi:RluA family pseudouridine synthase [Streptococcus loxodontisalivarius]|uniref:RNA pseudouridylate synthase n=1 Tax=Streptococcus loxodontisalivarius TaxID=1349415 RepID=A0ABS2PQH5_9STRE|nr:RluA family pseudouridine synthase [Streptococcus loxodontisalivarius]MBM7642302.1 23S rRNA pseudouridine1911/1915/1917 synthase [Streptococcus loxodontisalivarius]
MQFTITIPPKMANTTVKDLLEEHWLVPRKIRHFLRTKKHLLVNGQAINWQSPVKAGDVISLTFDQEDYPQKTIPFGKAELVDCLYQDEHLIIVNKPEGMKTHGNAPQEIALLNHVSAFVGQTCYVVHRLDMETSGAVIFAKNPFVLPILNRLLEDKLIQRSYWALAEGLMTSKQVTYRDKIGRDRHDRRKRLVDSKNGQTATTIVTKLKEYPSASLVKCQLKTGRTHQIRVHLSHHGHAIIGDPLYSRKAAPRLMLHAYQLSLTHPFTLESITVKAASSSFEKVLKSYE